MPLPRKPGYVVAVVGATSALGKEVIEQLEERRFPLERLLLLVSQVDDRSLPESRRGLPMRVELLKREAFAGVDLALFCEDPDIAARYSGVAAAAGALVLDLTGGTLESPGVAVVAPGLVAPAALAQAGRQLALPSPMALALAAVLAPLHAAAGVRRVVVATYEAAATAGQEGMDELLDQIRAILQQDEPPRRRFGRTLAFNVIPQTGPFGPGDETEPERELARSLQRLLGLPELRVTGTVARVPTFHGSAAAVNVELERPLSPEAARARLAAAPGVEVVDEPGEERYPVGLEAAGRDVVLVGRIRADRTVPAGLNLWLAADDLRRGGAVAALELLEALLPPR
ncbi:MAG TPA: aspartate-semialdehyde dehydrogenase [Thermodesulfobacteriota bacterium]|nr:aspartate-semialdehyde dehydrogenase [Thermodesulfobacteriota bacterium]